MMTALDAISEDLSWRESEIAAMRIIFSSTAISDGQRTVLLRAAWAMLYAHYEGFCKEALTIFYDAIKRSGTLCENLPQATKLYALDRQLRRLRSMNSQDFLPAVEKFRSSHLVLLPSFPEVDTESNLWPNVLIDLLRSADLNSDKVREHEIKLKTLVGRRNDIAHGKNNLIVDVSYYLTFENAVYDVMYDLAFQVDTRLNSAPYA